MRRRFAIAVMNSQQGSVMQRFPVASPPQAPRRLMANALSTCSVLW
jgi:hypothetical protein